MCRTHSGETERMFHGSHSNPSGAPEAHAQSVSFPPIQRLDTSAELRWVRINTPTYAPDGDLKDFRAKSAGVRDQRRARVTPRIQAERTRVQ